MRQREEEEKEDDELAAYWSTHPPDACFRCDHKLCQGSMSAVVYIGGDWGGAMDSQEKEEFRQSCGITQCGSDPTSQLLAR